MVASRARSWRPGGIRRLSSWVHSTFVAALRHGRARSGRTDAIAPQRTFSFASVALFLVGLPLVRPCIFDRGAAVPGWHGAGQQCGLPRRTSAPITGSQCCRRIRDAQRCPDWCGRDVHVVRCTFLRGPQPLGWCWQASPFERASCPAIHGYPTYSSTGAWSQRSPTMHLSWAPTPLSCWSCRTPPRVPSPGFGPYSHLRPRYTAPPHQCKLTPDERLATCS